uniref:NACHT domain-containing protein n=1 Tax=Strigamia maritima TaxID=126957 RepID=T1IJG3_STRMM
MDNRPSTSAAKHTPPKQDGSGNVTMNCESAKTINVQTYVDKRTYSNMPAEPEGTTSKQGSCCETIDTNGKQCDVFKLKLKEHYRNLVLPKLAWVQEGINLLPDQHFIQLELHESRKSIKIEEVFDSVDNERPVRILIEGQPGFGKTTLAIKLAHDWANGKNMKFDFVFFLPIRELKQQSIINAIDQTGKRCECDNAVGIVRKHKKNVLLILDGLDEMSQEERPEIMKILYKQLYGDVTVVVTCRTELFALSKDESVDLFGSVQMRDDFSDKRISILGITSLVKKREFLEKFMKFATIEAVIKSLSYQLDLFNSPLFLMTLSLLTQEGETIEEFSTKTDLYKKLFNCLVKHSYAKRELEIASNFDLFSFGSKPNSIQKQIQMFGELAAEKIVKNNFQFETSDLTKEIYELGMLINHKTMTLVKSTNYYEPIHLSVIEFLVAFSMWMNLKFGNSMEKCLTSTMNHFIRSSGTSLIIPFLFSLMGKDLDQLFYLIDSYSPWCCWDYRLVFHLLSECSPIAISESKHLSNFIPSYIHMSDCQSNEEITKQILNYGMECSKIKRIVINEFTKFEILPNEINTRLEIKIKLNSSIKFSAFSQVPCQSTRMLSRPIPFKGPLQECLRFAALSNCEFCALELGSYTESAEFLELVTKDKTIDKIKYKELKIEIRTEMEKQVVIKLLENNHVQFLGLKLEKQEQNSQFELSSVRDTNALSLAAAKSNHLTFIELKGVTIDLYDLTRGGIKKYIYIELVNCALTCRRPLLARNCCHRLAIHNLQNLEGIIALEPSVFQCLSPDIMKDLMIKHPTWTGFNTVKCFVTSPGFSDNVLLNRFINLQTLELFVYKAVHLDELANCIHVLPIVNLVINNAISSDISNLFERMNNLWSGINSSRLKTISLFERDANNYFSNAFELLEGLNRCHWDQVHLHSLGRYRDRDKLLKYLSDLNLIVFLSKRESIYFELDPLFNYFFSYVPVSDNMLSIRRN